MVSATTDPHGYPLSHWPLSRGCPVPSSAWASMFTIATCGELFSQLRRASPGESEGTVFLLRILRVPAVNPSLLINRYPKLAVRLLPPTIRAATCPQECSTDRA